MSAQANWSTWTSRNPGAPEGGSLRAYIRSSGDNRDRRNGGGCDYVHSTGGLHARLAYSEILADEKGTRCAAFLARAITSRPTAPSRSRASQRRHQALDGLPRAADCNQRCGHTGRVPRAQSPERMHLDGWCQRSVSESRQVVAGRPSELHLRRMDAHGPGPRRRDQDCVRAMISRRSPAACACGPRGPRRAGA